MLNKITYIIFILFIGLFSCKKSTPSFDKKEYLNWYNNHKDDFIKEKSIAVFNFSIQLIPAAVYSIKKVSNYSVTDDNLVYFKFEIINPKQTNEPLRMVSSDWNNFQDNIKFLTVDYKNNIKVQQNNQEFYPKIYIVEPTYNVMPKHVILIAFELSENWRKNDLLLIINDNLFNAGIIKYTFSKEKLTSIPYLKR